jgi:hypothetical protein
MSALQFER